MVIPPKPWAPLILPYVDRMTEDVCYVVTVQGAKVKRTTTGYYVDHDDDALILLDEKGKFRNVVIENIIRINYYKAGREPFSRGEIG